MDDNLAIAADFLAVIPAKAGIQRVGGHHLRPPPQISDLHSLKRAISTRPKLFAIRRLVDSRLRGNDGGREWERGFVVCARRLVPAGGFWLRLCQNQDLRGWRDFQDFAFA